MTTAASGLSFRYFRKEDQREIRELILQGLGDHFEVIDDRLNRDLDDINASYTAQGHTFVIAKIDGRTVGVGALMSLGKRVGRIVRLSVVEDHRRQGIGVAIVGHLVEMARARSFTRLLVETNHDWAGAIALYKQCGFLPYDTDKVSVHLQLDLDGS